MRLIAAIAFALITTLSAAHADEATKPTATPAKLPAIDVIVTGGGKGGSSRAVSTAGVK